MRNPTWANPERTLIDAIIDHPEFGEIPMTLAPQGATAALFAEAAAGAVAPYVAPPVPVPTSLPRLAFKAALLQAGLLDQVEAAVANADALTRLKWAEAVEFPRADPMIDALGQAIGLTPEAIDQMYVQAAGR